MTLVLICERKYYLKFYFKYDEETRVLFKYKFEIIKILSKYFIKV